jgi:hypothetical protein
MTTPRKRAPRKPAAPKVQPPPVQPPEPVYDLDEYEDHDWDYSQPRFPAAGIFVSAMFAVMASALTFMALNRHDRDRPEPVPVVVPINNLAAFTAPIAAKLATDRDKAAIVADAYLGLAVAIAGKTGERITSSRIFETAHAAFLTDLDAMGGVAVGAEIDQAIGSYLGMTKTTGTDAGWEPIAFDASHRVKLVEITAAIAEAAEAVK